MFPHLKDDMPYVLIAIEITVLGLVLILACAVLGWQYGDVLFGQQGSVLGATLSAISVPTITPRRPTPSAIPTEVTATPTPTSSPTLTSTPVVPTRTATLTPDPVKYLAGCATIDAPGVYQLTVNVSSNTAADCFKIRSSRVTFDCAGHTIHGIANNGYGIAVRKYGVLNDVVPSDVIIQKCLVTGFRTGIYVESGKSLTVRDNDSSDNYDDVDRGSRYGNFLGMTEGGGIRLNYVTAGRILNNTTRAQAIGIDVRYSSNIVVSGNRSSENSAWGINLLRTQNSQVLGNSVADNIRQCTWGAGVIGQGCDAGGIVLQDGSSGNRIANNSVTGKNGNGIFIKAHGVACGNDNTISGNTVAGALYNSVELGFCSGNKITGNVFRDGLDAIWLGFSHDTEISNNTIVNMKNHGIIAENSRNNVISGNRVTNSNVGMYLYTTDYDRTAFAWLTPGDYRSHDNSLVGNVFQSNAVSIHLKDSTNNQVMNNDFHNNARGIQLQGKTDGNNTQGNIN